MGVLSRLVRPFRRTVTKSDEVAEAKRGAAQYYGKSLDDVTPGDLAAYRGTDHFANRADDVITGAGRAAGFPVGAGIGVAGLGGSYAYLRGKEADVAVEEEQTARYERYQDRVQSLQEAYQNGDISYQEYQRALEQAQEDYYAASDQDLRGLDLYGLLAQMSTTQLLAVSGLTAIALYYVVAPAVRNTDVDISLEELLG